MWLTGWMLSGVFMAESGQPFTIFSGHCRRTDPARQPDGTARPRPATLTATSATLPRSLSRASPARAREPHFRRMYFSPQLESETERRAPLRGQFLAQPSSPGRHMLITIWPCRRPSSFGRLRHCSFAPSHTICSTVANYYNPISTYSLDGVTPYSQFGQIKSAHNPRQFQFAVRMNW